MIALTITKFALIFLLVSFLLVIITELAGRLTSRRILASASNSYFVPQTQLFSFISNPSDYPKWRSGVKDVKPAANHDQWQEIFGKNQYLLINGKESNNGTQIFHAQSTAKKPFAFHRTYTIYHKDKLSFLKIEDRLHFSSPALRLFAVTFYDHSSIIRQELKNIDAVFS